MNTKSTSDQPAVSKVKIKSIDEVHCPNCSALVHPSQININRSMGQCDSCENVFVFEKDDLFLDDRPGRPEMLMPEGTDLITLSDHLDVRVNWRKSYSKAGLGGLTFFTFFWNLIVGFFVINILMNGSIGALLGVSLHLIAGLGLLYWLASIFINYTDIIVKSDSITIDHYPLKNPFKSKQIIPATEFRQFYVSKYVSSTTNGKPNYAYALYAITHTGRNVLIINGMNKETQLYLEQEIERYLELADEPIAGSIQ